LNTIAGINFFTDYEAKSSHKRLSLGLEYQRANFSANINMTELLSKPSVLLMAWFLMLVVTLLPSWSVLSELVEPRAVRVTMRPSPVTNA
jgi:hypothetical protein